MGRQIQVTYSGNNFPAIMTLDEIGTSGTWAGTTGDFAAASIGKNASGDYELTTFPGGTFGTWSSAPWIMTPQGDPQVPDGEYVGAGGEAVASFL